jgi:hypothetical protein
MAQLRQSRFPHLGYRKFNQIRDFGHAIACDTPFMMQVTPDPEAPDA